MSYLVFARKYRPQRFEEIVAQDHVSRTLQNAVKNDRVGSGYLFCGPRGTGKTTTARVLAKALNCVNGPTPTPCGECSNCLEIAAGTSLDVLEIDAASNTGVDDIRTLRENVRYLPTGGKRRIYIIDEVHRLSGAAFDALLKTLEEPPPHVVFMFATTEPMKVPETILSRTQRFDMKRVGPQDLIKHMKWIAEQEKLEIDHDALTILARKADGSVRDSLSLLDQIAAFSGEKITEEVVITALGLVDRRLLFDYIEAVAANDNKVVLRLVKQVIDGGTDASDFVADLLEYLRKLLLLTTDKQSGELLEVTPDELAELTAQAEHFQVGDVVRLIGIAAALNNDLKARSGLNERLLLEVSAVRMASLESTVSIGEVLSHLGQAASSGQHVPAPRQKKKPEAITKSPPVQLQRGAEAPPEEPSKYPDKRISVSDIKSGWKSFMKALRSKNAMLASQLAMAEVRSVSGNQIRIVFGPSAGAARQLVERKTNLSLIVATLGRQYEANLGVAFEVDTEARPERDDVGDERGKKANAKEILEQSPRIRSLVDKFDGEIVGVRKKK
jgi:DNA polymerase-3 subunit gamma/tau